MCRSKPEALWAVPAPVHVSTRHSVCRSVAGCTFTRDRALVRSSEWHDMEPAHLPLLHNYGDARIVAASTLQKLYGKFGKQINLDDD